MDHYLCCFSSLCFVLRVTSLILSFSLCCKLRYGVFEGICSFEFDMAYNVFGNPITDETLKGIPEYASKTITRTDRARVALNMKNSANKDANARQYVENMKKEWGTGVSTLCLVYNATGDPVEFSTSHDYNGHLGPAPYPVVIANGQWGGFLHVKTAAASSGSCAAVVYRGKNETGDDCGWLLAWSNPWNTPTYDNKIYTEIRADEHFHGDPDKPWDTVLYLLNKSGIVKKDEWNGCVAYASTGCYTSPVVEGVMTLKNA